MASKKTAKTKNIEAGPRPSSSLKPKSQAQASTSSSSPAGTSPPETRPAQNPRPADELPILESWMKQTVVLKLKEVDGKQPDMTQEVFTKKMVLEQGFSHAETFSIQAFTRGVFYITFISMQVCRRYWEALKTAGPDSPFRNFTANSPIQREERRVTVMMRNPHTPAKDITTYLQRFCTVIKDPTPIMNVYSYWTGKWSIICRLRKDPNGEVQHLPASIYLGSSAGTLHYVDQPQNCWKCGKTGHIGKGCSVISCRVCHTAGHESKDCPRTKTCNLCGLADHTYRDCPQRSRSYAGALIWGRPVETGSTSKKPPKKTGCGKTSSPPPLPLLLPPLPPFLLPPLPLLLLLLLPPPLFLLLPLPPLLLLLLLPPPLLLLLLLPPPLTLLLLLPRPTCRPLLLLPPSPLLTCPPRRTFPPSQVQPLPDRTWSGERGSYW